MKPKSSRDRRTDRGARRPIETDTVIVGAGPVSLFQVFELRLLEIKAQSTTWPTRAASASSSTPTSPSTTSLGARVHRQRSSPTTCSGRSSPSAPPSTQARRVMVVPGRTTAASSSRPQGRALPRQDRVHRRRRGLVPAAHAEGRRHRGSSWTRSSSIARAATRRFAGKNLVIVGAAIRPWTGR